MKTELKQKIAFALVMGIVTTGIISFTLISINIGYTSLFWRIWLRSWATAYVVVVPAILFIGPKVQILVYRFIRKEDE
jgi:membrane protein YdbS with pleckstrin-like domain